MLLARVWGAMLGVLVALQHDHPHYYGPQGPDWHILTYPLWGLGGWIAGAIISSIKTNKR